MTPAWGSVFWNDWAVTSTLDCESPVTGVEQEPELVGGAVRCVAPEAVTVSVPLLVDSEPATPGLPMSWQVTGPALGPAGSREAGQLGSAGGVVVGAVEPEGVDVVVEVADVELALGHRHGAVDGGGQLVGVEELAVGRVDHLEGRCPRRRRSSR